MLYEWTLEVVRNSFRIFVGLRLGVTRKSSMSDVSVKCNSSDTL